MNHEDIIQRLDKIEHQLKFFSDAYKQLHNIFIQGVHINLEKGLLDPTLSHLTTQVREFNKLLYSMNEMLKNDSIIGTMAFLAKKIHLMEIAMSEMKENGIKKKVHLDFTIDGYEMVQKKPMIPDAIEEMINDPEEIVKKLLDTLEKRESEILMHRYGLLGHDKKTLDKTGKIMGISSDRVRQIQAKTLRKMRNPVRKKLVALLTHKELKKDILGEE